MKIMFLSSWEFCRSEWATCLPDSEVGQWVLHFGNTLVRSEIKPARARQFLEHQGQLLAGK